MSKLYIALLIFLSLSLPAIAQDAPVTLAVTPEPPTPIATDAAPVEDEEISDSATVDVIPGSMIEIEGEQIYLPMVHGEDLEQMVVSMAAVQPQALPDYGPFDPKRIPVELQAWWMPAYGHIHAAVMIPFGQAISGVVQVPVRIVMHNNPGQLFMLRVDDEQSTRIKMPLDLRCPTTICAWSFTLPLDTNKFPNGWRMFRFRAQVRTPDGKAFLNSSDIPMLVSNGSGGSNALRFGSTNYIVGKGWYEGFDYTNVAIEHVPTKPVSGLLALRVQVHKGGANLIVDLDKSHFIPAVGPWPLVGDTPGVPLLNTPARPGEWRDIVIDTNPLANGWHSFQVRTDNPRGAVSVCTGCPPDINHPAGVAKFWFYVQNGATVPATATPTPTQIGATLTPTPPGAPTNTPTTAATPTRTPIVTNTAVAPPTPVPGATATATPPTSASAGLWISAAEVKALPMSGGAWSAVLAGAGGNCTPDLNNQDSDCNVTILAQALAFARTDDEQYRVKVVAAIRSIVSTQSESGGRTLALGRELGAYVAAADLINLRSHDPQLHNAFTVRLRDLRAKTLDGMTLAGCHERRGNNWGTHCGASRAAIDVYTGDAADLARTAAVFAGWLGDRGAYAGFTWGDLDWQCNPSAPVGINSTGCQKSGHDIGGALPDDMRRGGAFKMPSPAPTGYACGGMSGAVAQAEILYRAGYLAYEWSDRALLRAMEFLQRIGWQCTGDDAWLVAVINKRYGTSYPVDGTSPGKNMGWSQWTHAPTVAAAAALQAVESDIYLVATGESPGDLAGEIEYQAQFGWRPVGEVYMIEAPDDGLLYAQDMVRGE